MSKHGEVSGHEIHLLFENIDRIVEFEPEEGWRDTVREMWNYWRQIQFYLLSADATEIINRIQALPSLLDNFYYTYARRYTFKAVTPYIHILCAHLVPVLLQHGSIGLYSQESFEATHKYHRRIFQRGSSHNGGKSKLLSSKQILQRIYRTIQLRIDLNIPPNYSATFPKLSAYVRTRRKRKDKKEYVK